MDTPIKKNAILFIFHLSSCEIQFTYAEQCHHSVLFYLFLNSLSLSGIRSKVYSVDLLRAEVEKPWPGGTAVPDPGLRDTSPLSLEKH